MDLLRDSLQRLLDAAKRSRLFDADQKVALIMFDAAVARATSAEQLAGEWRIVKKLLNRRLALLTDMDRSLVRSLNRGWDAAVAVDLQRNQPTPIDCDYDPIHLGA